MLQILTAFFIHQTILSGKLKHWASKSESDQTFTGFMVRSFGFALLLIVLVVAFSVMVIGSSYYREEYGDLAIILIIVFASLIYGVVLAFFGTVLPATVAQGNKSFAVAFQRGRKTFWYTFWRLIIGPALFVVLSVTLLAFLSQANLPLDVYDSDGSLSPVGALLSFPQYLIKIFTATLVATVLCKAYLRYERRPNETPSAP